jgi:hypothetical protein
MLIRAYLYITDEGSDDGGEEEDSNEDEGDEEDDDEEGDDEEEEEDGEEANAEVGEGEIRGVAPDGSVEEKPKESPDKSDAATDGVTNMSAFQVFAMFGYVAAFGGIHYGRFQFTQAREITPNRWFDLVYVLILPGILQILHFRHLWRSCAVQWYGKKAVHALMPSKILELNTELDEEEKNIMAEPPSLISVLKAQVMQSWFTVLIVLLCIAGIILASVDIFRVYVNGQASREYIGGMIIG